MQPFFRPPRPLTILFQTLITFSLLVGTAQAADPKRQTNPNVEGGADQSYQSKLPRLEPRLFKEVFALHFSIKEVLDFRAFENLRSYAADKILLSVACDRSMLERPFRGNPMTVDEVFERLKGNFENRREILLRGVVGANRYIEIKGGLTDPFIYLGFTEDIQEWDKIAFCKDDSFVRSLSENAGSRKAAMRSRLIQAVSAVGVIVLVGALWAAYRHERKRQTDLALAGGGEAAAPMARTAMKRTLSGLIGIILIIGLVMVSIWSSDKALTLEGFPGASSAEIGRYQLIQKVSLAGILAVLAALILLNRKDKKKIRRSGTETD